MNVPAPEPRGSLLKRAALVGATAFLSINLWTGAPLIALWVGSQVVGKTVLSMQAVIVVILVLAVLVFSMAIALAWLSATYDRLSGRVPGERRMAWLRGVGAVAGLLDALLGAGISPLERVVMTSVYLAVISFLVWFFGFAGAPTPSL